MSDPYDPQAVEDKPRGSQYVSRKDVKILAIVLAIGALLGWPIYMFMLKGVNSSQCEKNLRKISGALLNYLSDNDDHFPYAYETLGYQSTDPSLHSGLANSWHFQLQQYIGNWQTFKCPGAEAQENSKVSNGDIISVISYGMLNAYSGTAASSVANPGQRVIISETAKNGVNDTSDPVRIPGVSEDGYVIGFSNALDYPDDKTLFASRLAFPGSAKSGFGDQTDSRHPSGNHFLMVDGSMRTAGAGFGKVIQLSGSFGQWDVPRPVPPLVPKTRGP